ncbi:MAG: VCBS repeat-containing protein [Bryobacterales bacterium]|jgi:hypothetical protein|nr:VCBS repeat-containing protein [Bryobacterales bacterium]
MVVLNPNRTLHPALDGVPALAVAAVWLLVTAFLFGIAASPLSAAPTAPAPAITPQALTLNLQLDADVYPDEPGLQGLRIQLAFDGADWQVLGMRSPCPIRRGGKSCSKGYLTANRPLPRAVPASPRLASLSERVQPLGFVLVDMDSDNDLDVVVVHRTTGLALSAWRNLGKGRLEPLARHAYGLLSFPLSSIAHQPMASALDGGFAAGSGFPIRIHRLTRRNQMGQGIVVIRVAAQPTTPAPQESLGRAPPNIA